MKGDPCTYCKFARPVDIATLNSSKICAYGIGTGMLHIASSLDGRSMRGIYKTILYAWA